MFARNVGVRVLRQCVCLRPAPCSRRIPIRKSSTSTSSSATGAEAQGAFSTHPLAGVASQLDHVAPRFEIEPSQIEILDSPTSFYETLKTKIRHAKKRIFLSTLYVGKTEHELIQAISEALENNPELEVSILTDALRGTREDPEPSCATLLAPLISSHGDRVKICMFHTPNLNGWKKRWMPKRINEGWGLQHMKIYGCDDEVILSGANLSNDYFTDRLDRYHVFNSKPLADWYAAVQDAICEISYDVLPSNTAPGGFELISPHNRGLPDPVNHSKKFKIYAKRLLEPLIHRRARQKMFPTPFEEGKTFVYPLAQFDILLGQPSKIAVLDYEFAQYTSTEKPAITKLLTSLAEDEKLHGSRWTFTAGYFNIDPDICQQLLDAAPSVTASLERELAEKPCTVITASPWANGFYGSKGISGMLPAAYTLLSRRFLREVSKAGKSDSIALKEWRKGTVGEPGGHTYHAKGMWVTLPPQLSEKSDAAIEEAGPSVTLIGSSNYTKRSYSLDLEVGALILTSDDELKRKFKAETEWLQKDASVTTLDDLMRIERRVGFNVRAAMWLVQKLGGAL